MADHVKKILTEAIELGMKFSDASDKKDQTVVITALCSMLVVPLVQMANDPSRTDTHEERFTALMEFVKIATDLLYNMERSE